MNYPNNQNASGAALPVVWSLATQPPNARYLGFLQIDAPTLAAGLILPPPPAGTTIVNTWPHNGVRYRGDGTLPTPTVGTPYAYYNIFWSAEQVASLHFITDSNYPDSTMDITYWGNPVMSYPNEQVDPRGSLPTYIYGYDWPPSSTYLQFYQITDLSTPVTVDTFPPGTTCVAVVGEGSVRFRGDGIPPTGDVGTFVYSTAINTFAPEQLATLQWIEATGTTGAILNITCWGNP